MYLFQIHIRNYTVEWLGCLLHITRAPRVYINKPCTLKYFNFNHTFMSSSAPLFFCFCADNDDELDKLYRATKIAKDCQLFERIMSDRPVKSVRCVRCVSQISIFILGISANVRRSRERKQNWSHNIESNGKECVW